MAKKKKAVIEIDLLNFSNKIVAKKANDDSVSLPSFEKAVAEQEKLAQKIKPQSAF